MNAIRQFFLEEDIVMFHARYYDIVSGKMAEWWLELNSSSAHVYINGIPRDPYTVAGGAVSDPPGCTEGGVAGQDSGSRFSHPARRKGQPDHRAGRSSCVEGYEYPTLSTRTSSVKS